MILRSFQIETVLVAGLLVCGSPLLACEYDPEDIGAFEVFHLCWIDKVAFSEVFNFEGADYDIVYLPVGTPVKQARGADGFLNPGAVLDPLIFDSGVRTLEVSRNSGDQFWPQDETEAKSVAKAYCIARDGWPVVDEEVERTAQGQMSDDEDQLWHDVSFSHGVFRFPEVCYDV